MKLPPGDPVVPSAQTVEPAAISTAAPGTDVQFGYPGGVTNSDAEAGTPGTVAGVELGALVVLVQFPALTALTGTAKLQSGMSIQTVTNVSRWLPTVSP